MNTHRLDAQTLRGLLSYDRETGVFTWLVRRGRTANAGSPAGHLNGGRISIRVLGRLYFASRLAWLYETGEWPAQHIDHINGNPSDNSFKNLRDVPRTINMQNLRAAKRNSRLGLLGISMKGSRYQAQICISGKAFHLGYFDTAEEASSAYITAKRDFHPGSFL